MSNKIALMMDVETFGNNGKFVVLSVALVPFVLGDKAQSEALTQIEDPFYMVIDLADSLSKGFKCSQDTLEWWGKQDPAVLRDQLTGGKDIKTVIAALSDYLLAYQDVDVYVTATLDHQAISLLADSVNAPNPIIYRNRLCARTITKLATSKGLGSAEYPRSTPLHSNNHSPVQDCINQIRTINEEFEFLFGSK